MTLDDDTCYRALTARDGRFDGVFFVAVSTTGIYCRPVCRARTPGRERCAFYRSAATAERDGYRACFRCRPELAPGAGLVDALPRLVARAVARIDAGFLNEGSVDDLAALLGVTGRHLRRAMETELGVSPIELAQTRRLALAKQLLQDTSLPLSEIAFASGFASVRRFNALFQTRFGRPPSALRRERAVGSQERNEGTLVLRLDYRPPLDWSTLLTFLAGRAIPGAERVTDGVYARTVRLGDLTGWITVQHDEKRAALRIEAAPSLADALMPLSARLRALFDLDAHPTAIAAHLGRDPLLAGPVARHPGLRVPGAFDGFEMTIRAVLGQQVSVRAATTLAGRLAARFGDPLTVPIDGLGLLFPTPARLAAAAEDDVASLGLPATRARAILAIARAIHGGTVSLDRHGDPEAALPALCALPGIGDWTAHYVAMRALGWPDAFPSGDLAVRKAMGGITARAATTRAEPWRPWRAYAVMHLWTSLSDGAGG
ncbi:AlkA N-terminal domain-containing protein [Chondromyces crocatus]|uniref:AlkA N-terminal domain-containing protein n=1 Tax=Chondromyces crocatus TaxID=52 RepID=UPI00067AA283|nr:AlkA N-terminal domain-containing protein [Chondromyces crocatus]